MRRLRSHLVALIGVLPIVLGLILPAVALPCVRAEAAGLPAGRCDCCDKAALGGAPACGLGCQPGIAEDRSPPAPASRESAAWFADALPRLDGGDPRPEAPPPR